MKKFGLVFIFFAPFLSFSQDFSRQEVQRIEQVLKRSISVLREFNATTLVSGSSLISVEILGNSEIEASIENALFRSGFEVVSSQVARDVVKIRSNDNEASNNPTYKSVYFVTVSGQYFKGALFGKCQRAMSSFTARIVDLAKGGKLVGTFQFSENTMTYIACEEDIANAFSYKLLETVK